MCCLVLVVNFGSWSSEKEKNKQFIISATGSWRRKWTAKIAVKSQRFFVVSCKRTHLQADFIAFVGYFGVFVHVDVGIHTQNPILLRDFKLPEPSLCWIKPIKKWEIFRASFCLRVLLRFALRRRWRVQEQDRISWKISAFWVWLKIVSPRQIYSRISW